MAGIIKGIDFNLYVPINGYNYAVCQATDCQLTMTGGEALETTTKFSPKGRTYNYGGKYGYTIQLNGITSFVDIGNIAQFQDYLLNSNKFFFTFTDGNSISYTGTVLINQINIDSPSSGISQFSQQMLGDGELVPVVTGVTPPPAGSSVTIIDQFGETIAVVPAPGNYQVLRFDTIDKAGWADPDLIIMKGQ